MAESLPRVMWLLNHFTARKFEVGMLKKLGFTEIFLPKSFPQEVGSRSTSVDYSEDANLSIPAEDLAILNAADWYHGPDRDTWEVANRHFDLLFFVAQYPSIFRSVSTHFRGAAILRGYGLGGGTSYAEIVKLCTGGVRTMENLGRRFWLGTAYPQLASIEPRWLKQRSVCLPIGLHDCQVIDNWNGSACTIFFVCPEILGNPYYQKVYREFKEHLGDLPYIVGGAQSLAVPDPKVLGFVSDEHHQRNMRECRVMFYHSTEPNHVHYHPFEGIRGGMPLLFLGGGMLDRIGGTHLPGRCKNYAEARAKLRRILADDRRLIDEIRTTQVRLLDEFHPENLEPLWRKGLTRVLSELENSRVRPASYSRRSRIAVILPVAYRGGTLRSAKLLAQALWIGSRQSGEDVDVVLAYPHLHNELPDGWDADLPTGISRRTIEWRRLDPATARRAMRNGGHTDWVPAGDYMVPDDGIQHLCDCDLWVVVSDRLSAPLLPIRPYALAVYDYLQRYVSLFSAGTDQPFLAAARAAERVLVTTRFTEQDALIYAGLPRKKVFRVPVLVPEFDRTESASSAVDIPYFLWTTNLGPHKNHYRTICALREYYELLGGQLDCRVSGVNTRGLLTNDLPHLKPVAALVAESEVLSERLHLLGEIPDASYGRQLANAVFLWHSASIDNGTLSVIEAAHLGVPSLSSRYPAMQEIDAAFQLNLAWMDASEPSQMARQLKWMEENAHSLRDRLPAKSDLAQHRVDQVAHEYWQAVRECL